MIHSMKRFNRVDETRSALSSPLVNLYFYDLPKHYQDEYKAYDLPRFCTILQGSKEVRINQSESFVYQKDQFILLPLRRTSIYPCLTIPKLWFMSLAMRLLIA